MSYSPKQQFDDLMNAGKMHIFPKKHQVIIDPELTICYLINEGFIKRYLLTQEGTYGVQAVFGPGDIFPLTPVYKAVFDFSINRGKEIYYYETVTECTMHSVSKRQLTESLEQQPNLFKDLFYVAGMRLENNIFNLENASLRASHDRIYDLLLWLGEKYGEKREESFVLKLPITHELIAEMLNLARETVSKRMVRLQELGVVKKNEGLWYIKVKI
jgi:CRP/FNR family transcriptional regulator